MDAGKYVRTVLGSENTGKGGQRYTNVEVYDAETDSYRTVRSCADANDAAKVESAITKCMEYAYREGVASTRR